MAETPFLSALPSEVDLLVEMPRWSMVKRRPDGSVDFVSPVPCPFNYGCVPGARSGDGDPLDVVLMGPRLPRGTRRRVAVVGVIGFLDAGCEDAKVICSERPLGAWDRLSIEWFFRLYAQAKRLLHLARREPGETRYLGWLRAPSLAAGAERREGSP